MLQIGSGDVRPAHRQEETKMKDAVHQAMGDGSAEVSFLGEFG